MARGGPLRTDPKGSTKVQAIWFKAIEWTVAKAKAWLRKKKYKYILFEKATKKK